MTTAISRLLLGDALEQLRTIAIRKRPYLRYLSAVL